MAIPTNIRSLLYGNVVEWARIEFKTTWDSEVSLKTIVAFANDLDNWGGGYIVLGVEEKDGVPIKPYAGVPLNKIDAWQKDIFEKCKLIRPGYTPIIGKDELDGKTFLIVWYPGGDARPYSCPKTMARNDKERSFFIRKGSVTALPNDDELKELFSLANKTPFDDRVNHSAELSDLNYALIKSYLKEIDSSLYTTADETDFETLCRDMNLISDLPEYVKPKNVALMFFNSEPEKFFPYAQIDVVQFPEGEGGDKIIEQIFTGPLHEQLRAALRYIKNTIITEQIVKHPDRAEADRFFNYPYEAIEESLSNAVYHKAYDEREPIEIRVERDMIEIISHPGQDRSVTLEGLRAFKVRSRRYRNRRIGEFLKELHLTEGRNTGFRKIIEALRRNGSPMPEFETDEAHDYFITRLFVRKNFYDFQRANGALNGAPGGAPNGALGGVSDGTLNGALNGALGGALNGALGGSLDGSPGGVLKGSVDGSPGGSPDGALGGALGSAPNGALKNVDDKRKRLCELIVQNPKITREQIASELNMGKRSVQRLLNAMPDVRFTGGGRSGRWEIVE